MALIEKSSSAAYYPFRYVIRWQTSKKYIKFGQVLNDKWNAICLAVSKERDIYVDESPDKRIQLKRFDVILDKKPIYHLDSTFDSVYFYLKSVPKVSPLVVLESIKRGVYPILIEVYPSMRNELINDQWCLIDPSKISLKRISKREFPVMDYIPYYIRTKTKWNKAIFDKTIRGINLHDELKKILFEVRDEQNKLHPDRMIDIDFLKIFPRGMEIVIISPIKISVSEVAKIIKANTSKILRERFPEFRSNQNNPFFVSYKGFWAGSNFFAISSRPVTPILDYEQSLYLNLEKRWNEVKTESNWHKKGKLLELFVKEMLDLTESFNVITTPDKRFNINLYYEEIDIGIKNKSNYNLIKECGPIILVECKNWSERTRKVGNDEIRNFATKLRKEITTGIMISVNGFGKFEEHLLTRLFYNNKFIITITGEEIEEWLDRILQTINDVRSKRGTVEVFLKEAFERFFEDKITWTYLELK